MEMTLPRASISLALVLIVLCTVDSIGGNYLAFPRMGRSGYLAFPRMGRSLNKVGDVSDCCGVGLKSEFLIGQGKDEVRYICAAVGGACCEGLRELIAEKPDGVGYSMCIPDVDAKSASSSQVINKLKNLLQN